MMTEQEYDRYMRAYCGLLNNRSVLSSERNGVKSVTVRQLLSVDDLSRPDELRKGDDPAVVVFGVDRLIEFKLAPKESLIFDEKTNTATFTSNGTKYTISSAEKK